MHRPVYGGPTADGTGSIFYDPLDPTKQTVVPGNFAGAGPGAKIEAPSKYGEEALKWTNVYIGQGMSPEAAQAKAEQTLEGYGMRRPGGARPAAPTAPPIGTTKVFGGKTYTYQGGDPTAQSSWAPQ